MTRSRILYGLLAVCLLLGVSAVLAQSGTEPVTLYILGGTDVLYDPQANYTDWTAINHLFLGLIDFHPVSRQIVPRLATAWTFDEATDTWTFTLRDDVSWVRRDAETGAIVPVRPVVAADFVTGLRRACDPRLGNYYRMIVATVVAGCKAAAEADPATFDSALLEQVEARAVDDTTLAVTLTGPRMYFLSITWLPALRAVPGEVIEQYGEAWSTPEHLVTNGPFVVAEVETTVRASYERNPWLPADLAGPGNLERVVVLDSDMASTTEVLLYLDNEIDRVGFGDDINLYVTDNPDLVNQLVQVAFDSVFSLYFDLGQPPFDNVHARRAFSAALDRQAYVTDILPGSGVPMMHLIPPISFGSSPIDEVGIDQGPSPGFDPDFARAELALAGYPDCQGFPEISFVIWSGGGLFGEYLQGMYETHLGCPPDILSIEEYDFVTMLDLISKETPSEERPNLWFVGWGPDYPDANNWLYDAGLHCESTNDMRAPCTAWDDLVLAAQAEIDPQRRMAMYREAEEMMFGYEGEFRIAPFLLSAWSYLVKPWLSAPSDYALLNRWDWITIDAALQQAARAAS